MIVWGPKSQLVIVELHADLQWLLETYRVDAPKELDISLIDGWRPGVEQDAALARGASTKPAGQSKHNVFPSRAFDFKCAPEPDPMLGHYERSLAIAYAKRVGFMMAIAARGGNLKLRFGINWREPYDPYHVELA